MNGLEVAKQLLRVCCGFLVDRLTIRIKANFAFRLELRKYSLSKFSKSIMYSAFFGITVLGLIAALWWL
jgi:hypothetical protein